MIYTIKTRLTKVVFLQHFLFYWLPPFIFFFPQNGLSFSLGFIAFYLIYECGYIHNDQAAEQHDRIKREKPSERIKNYPLEIIIRLILAFSIGFNISLHFLLMLILLLCVFYVHNIVRTKMRACTFFLLQLFRYLWPLSFVNSSEQIYLYSALALALAAAFSITYAIKKGIIFGDLYLLKTNNLIIVSLLSIFFTIPLYICYSINNDLLFIFLIGPCIFITEKFVRLLHLIYQGKTRYKNVVSHCHTNYSHDASLKPDELSCYAYEKELDIIHLTDHIQDITSAEFEARKHRYSKRIFMHGMEYNVLDQHVLVHSLGSYIDNQLICKYIMNDKRPRMPYILAHPNPSIRKFLTDKKYAYNFMKLLSQMKGVEIKNYKAKQNFRNTIRFSLITLVGVFIFEVREIYFGDDFHTKDDLLTFCKR
ncbi:PHP domain-containing protein [Planktomarina temperata]|nr:PHP domain-containing protein [Planktomarina temperata]